MRKDKYFALKNPTPEQYDQIKELTGDWFNEYHYELAKNRNPNAERMMTFAADSYISMFNTVYVQEAKDTPINPQCFYEFLPFDEYLEEVKKRIEPELAGKIARKVFEKKESVHEIFKLMKYEDS